MSRSDDITTWAGHVFGQATALGCVVRALSEFVELLAELNRQGVSGSDLAKEAADVAICLHRIAGLYGYDLDQLIDAKMALNRARRWHPHGDGHGSHCRLSGDVDHCAGCEKYGKAVSGNPDRKQAVPAKVVVAIGAAVRAWFDLTGHRQDCAPNIEHGVLIGYNPDDRCPFLVAYGRPSYAPAWCAVVEYLDEIPPASQAGTVATVKRSTDGKPGGAVAGKRARK